MRRQNDQSSLVELKSRDKRRRGTLSLQPDRPDKAAFHDLVCRQASGTESAKSQTNRECQSIHEPVTTEIV